MLIPAKQANLLYNLSKLAYCTAALGVFTGHPYLGSGVFVGSLLAQKHWSYPIYGFWRTADMTWIQLLIWCHLWTAYQSPILPTYISIQGIGVSLYFISNAFAARQRMWAATLCHAGVHILANGSVALLYWSTKPPLTLE